MLHPISKTDIPLYSLKDLHAIYKDEYDNYADLYIDLEKLGFEVAYIDDSQKLYLRKKVEMAAAESRRSQFTSKSETTSTSDRGSKRNRSYGIEVKRK